MAPLSNESAAQPLLFPLRLAATDVGSNAIRFLAVEFTKPGKYSVLEQIRMPVRLGHDAFLTGQLTDAAITSAVNAFGTFAGSLKELDIQRHRAVATSAVRESRNGDVLIGRALRETGIALEAITGAEEARLVHVAVRHRVRMGRSEWVVADLGGGSVEVSIVDSQGIFQTETYPIGSVRLLEALTIAGDTPADFRKKVVDYTAALRDSKVLQTEAAGLVATGGNIEALAKLAEAKQDRKNVSALPVKDLRAIIERLARMSFEERVTLLSLREDRADVILPAALVYERIADIAATDTIIVPNVGLKEGVILDLFETHVRATSTGVDGEAR